jgi:DNA-binding transcriptional LysR family regulator
MDRMTSMATFVKVVECGGFSAAARALGISPSMVTTHVRALEERLAVRLLNRSTRKVSLTEAGHAYYERCLQILTDVEEAERIAEALQSTPRGTLRLNTSVAIPPFLAPVIAEFASLFPEVSVNLAMTDRMVDLVEEGFDLAVRNMSVPDSSLIARCVATYRFVICGHPVISPRAACRESRPNSCITIAWSILIPRGATNGILPDRRASNRWRWSETCKPTATTHSGWRRSMVRVWRWRRAFCSSTRSSPAVSSRC